MWDSPSDDLFERFSHLHFLADNIVVLLLVGDFLLFDSKVIIASCVRVSLI